MVPVVCNEVERDGYDARDPNQGDVLGLPGIYSTEEAAAVVGLSLRTVRFYRKAGLAVPSARVALRHYDELEVDLCSPDSDGPLLYNEADLERLRLLKPMELLGFSLDEMREFVKIYSALNVGAKNGSLDQRLVDGLHIYAREAELRGRRLPKHAGLANAFAADLRRLAQSGLS